VRGQNKNLLGKKFYFLAGVKKVGNPGSVACRRGATGRQPRASASKAGGASKEWNYKN